MEISKTASNQTSNYGQACVHCYKAKCRCVRSKNGESCQRCLRLNKKCEPSESIRRQNAQATEESAMRIARLEDKMESLLVAMQSFIGTPGTSASSVNVHQPLELLQHHQPINMGSNSSKSSSDGTRLTPTSPVVGSSEDSMSMAGPVFTLSPNPNSSLVFPSQRNSLPLSPLASNQADSQLEFFRTRMLPSFPFIDLNPYMTSSHLRRDRPFLLQAIHTVTTFSTQERLVQAEELKHILFRSALIDTESNIDLLLGLLTYIAWSTDAFLGRADLVSRLMMLAISLVYDLRLFKPSSPDVQVMMAMTTQAGFEEDNQRTKDETPHGLLERQRAVLACFVLSSNISSHLGRQDAIRWTLQMEEALRVITLTQACAADALFVAQVRLQLLKQRAEEVRQQDKADCHLSGVPLAAASAPRILYLKTLRRQLYELKASFLPDLQQTDILNAQLQYVELYINQLAYSISQDSLSLGMSGYSGDNGILLEFERLECLWRSVENIKSWLDSFYKIPSSRLIGQPFHFWSQMILSITLLKYLSTLKDPDWDLQAVRNTVHLITTMDCLLQKFDLSSKEPELHSADHLLKFLSKLFSRCRLWAEARWNIDSQPQDPCCHDSSPDANANSHHMPDLDQMTWMHSMDLGDDQWFGEALGMPTTFY